MCKPRLDAVAINILLFMLYTQSQSNSRPLPASAPRLHPIWQLDSIDFPFKGRNATMIERCNKIYTTYGHFSVYI